MQHKLKCSFCGKTEHQVQRLIAGPRVFICDNCVGTCNEILAAHPPEGPLPSAHRIVARGSGSWLRRLLGRRMQMRTGAGASPS
ncbi:MAG: hypothetical protein JO163_16205 [Methylobacteriaceae bacterium]|nr:hypothetical protein [Methylobacteriaceae bacterium]